MRILVFLVAVVAVLFGTAAAAGETNPWTYQMTGPGDGLIIRANDGANSQVFEIFDYLGAPIFACNKAGGCAMFGDNFSVFAGGEVFKPRVHLNPHDNPPKHCELPGALWIGGQTGQVWRCTDFYGAKLWFPMTWGPT